MKKLFVILGAVSFTLGAKELNLDRMSVYPGDYRHCYQKHVLSRTAEMKSVCIYNWINVKEGGSMTLLLKYRLSKGLTASISLNFMKEKGRNGDAGNIQFKLPEGTGEIVETKHGFKLPRNAYQAQVVISLPGGDAKIELEKISFEIVPAKTEGESPEK